MSQSGVPEAPHIRPRRRNARAYIWFAGMVGFWVAFAVIAVVSAETLSSVWDWVQGLPLVAEIALWVLTLPGMLGLAVWGSSWDEWLRILLVVCIGGAWITVSIPRDRAREGDVRLHWEIRRGDPHDVVLTRKGVHHVRG